MLEETVAVARRVHRFRGHATIRQAARAAGKKMRRPVDPNTGASSVAVGVRACVCQCSATVDRRLVRPVSIRCGGADDRKRKRRLGAVLPWRFVTQRRRKRSSIPSIFPASVCRDAEAQFTEL